MERQMFLTHGDCHDKTYENSSVGCSSGIGLTLMGCGEGDDGPNTARAQNTGRDFVAPIVFQAAGPDIASIQNTVEQYRTALDVSGGKNNNNDRADR